MNKNDNKNEHNEEGEPKPLEEAFKEKYSSEKLDQPFLPIKTHTEVIYLTLGVLLAGAFFWLIFGSIPIIVEGRGIVIAESGLYSVQSKTSGIVKKILVKPGDYVKEGQLLAIIDDPEEEIKYQNAVLKLEKTEEELKKLSHQIGVESLAEKQALQKMVQANEASILELEKTIPKWEEELKNKEKLYQEKLMGLSDLQETRQALSQNRIALETTKATLVTLKANLAKMYRFQELKEKERQLLQIKQEKDALRLSLDYGYIYSQDKGIVLELLVALGDRVLPGTALMHLEYAQEHGVNRVFYGYVPINEGKIIRENMTVEIEPSTVNIEEYGAIVGVVKEVSLFAISKEKVANLIQNESLVAYLMQGMSAATQLVIFPILDPTTPTGFKWTSGKGPTQPITTGTVCKISVIAERVSPLFYYFSLWRLEKIKNNLKEFWRRAEV